MTATDFYLDGLYASDFDLMIASVGGDNSDDVSGGGVEYSVAKTPDNDEYRYYTHQWNEPLVWNLTLVKNPCASNNYYFTYEECRQITKWLQSTGKYRWIHFEEEGFDDLFYNVYINVSPNKVGGQIVGFDLVITSNCGYGFSSEKVITGIVNSNQDFEFDVDSDVQTYILPNVEIASSGSYTGSAEDTFCIYNNSDIEQNLSNNKATILNNISFDNVPIFDYGKYFLDSKNEVFDFYNLLKTNAFNYYFIRLVNGKNVIKTTANYNLNLKITYREPRQVII